MAQEGKKGQYGKVFVLVFLVVCSFSKEYEAQVSRDTNLGQ